MSEREETVQKEIPYATVHDFVYLGPNPSVSEVSRAWEAGLTPLRREQYAAADATSCIEYRGRWFPTTNQRKRWND